MATTAPVLKTPREILRDSLYDAMEAKKQKLYSGPLEGSEIVLWDDVRMIVNDRMPPTSDHGAEVATPGRVVVFATCPRCGQSAPIALEVTPELRVDSQAGHLHLKGKSKPVTHVCGQLRADLRTDGQEGFELEDIIGGEAESNADADEDAEGRPTACDYPYCINPLGHGGDHDIVKPDEANDDSDAPVVEP